MQKTKMLRIIKSILIILVIIASLITISDEIQYRLNMGNFDDSDSGFAMKGCNIAGITLHGDIYTYYDSESQSIDDVSTSEDIVYLLETAEFTPNIEAILLEIDSYGGSPVASREIVDTIKNFVTIPVVVQIREAGLSGAYWVASASDYIFASELSDIGSIGVTQSYLDESGYNQREGFIYNSLNTGKFKDILDPQKSLTWEEKQLLQRDLDIIYEFFIKDVSENRGIDIEKVKKLADGSSMLGQMALENGLIDEIGGYYEVLDYFYNTLEIDPVVCW